MKHELTKEHTRRIKVTGSAQGSGNGKSDVNKKLGLLKERLKNIVRLSFEKTVVHHEDPAKYPLSTDSNSIERAFYNVLEALPRMKRNRVIDKINKTLKAGASERKTIYKELTGVNFKTAVSVAEQVKMIPVPEEMKITESDREKVFEIIKGKSAKKVTNDRLKNKPQPQAAVSANKVAFIADDLTCINPDDLIKDEISLAGFGADSEGNFIDIETFFAGDFKKGETVTLNRKLAEMVLPGQFPAEFAVSLFIIESDLISSGELLLKLKILMEVIGVALYAAAVVAIILVMPTLAGILALIGAGFIALKYVFILMSDDFSFDTDDTLTLLDKINVGDSFERLLKIGKGFNFGDTFDGEYNLTGKWIGEA